MVGVSFNLAAPVYPSRHSISQNTFFLFLRIYLSIIIISLSLFLSLFPNLNAKTLCRVKNSGRPAKSLLFQKTPYQMGIQSRLSVCLSFCHCLFIIFLTYLFKNGYRKNVLTHLFFTFFSKGRKGSEEGEREKERERERER